MSTNYGYDEPTNFFNELWTESEIEYWFSFANDGSLFYLIIPFFILELIRYTLMKRMNWNLVGDSIANIITLVIFIGMEIVLGVLFLYQLYFWIYENFSLWHLPLNTVTILSSILLADFAYYWDHRLMHSIGLGWATHTVHHSSPHFNMSVAYRFGPAAELFVQTYQAILHTEVIGKLPKPIEYLFNTPSHHRVHHGVNQQYWDMNYGGIFIIWDRLFGTFTQEQEKVVYGVSEPLDSVNPLKVFFHGFTRLFRDMSKAKGIKNKLAFLIKPPGWRPEEY